jgi:transposase
MDEHTYDGFRRAPKDDLEIVTRRVRRRRWPVEERLAIVRESLAPDAIVAHVARRHEISTALIYTWRKAMLSSAMTEFVPVAVAAPEETAPLMVADGASGPVAPRDAGLGAHAGAGLIEIVFPDGRRIRVDADVDGAALGRVMRALANA